MAQTRSATMTVINHTGELVLIAIDHQYGNNFRSNCIRPLKPGEQTSFGVQYNTGLGTTGQDWFHVIASFENGEVWKIESNGIQEFLNAVESFASDIITLATSLIPGGKAIAPIAQQLVQAVTNKANLKGYRAHILRAKDEGALNTIELYRNTESRKPFLRFRSPSGVEDFLMVEAN